MSIDDLPCELLNRIHRLAVGVFRDQPSLYTRMRVVVCGVSPRWQATAFADTVLWTHVFVDAKSTPADIARWVGQSQGRLLAFHILITRSSSSPEFVDWFRDCVAPHLPHCNSFTLICPRLAPTTALMLSLATMDGSFIQSIHLDIHPDPIVQQMLGHTVPYLFQNSMPLLTTFSLRRNFILWNAPSYYHSLQELRLHSLDSLYQPSVDNYLDLFRATPLLVRLFLKDIHYLGGRSSCLPLPTLPRLTHLAVVGVNVDAIDVVGYLIMPSLYTVRLEIDDIGEDFPVDYMNIAWRRVFTRVTTVILHLMTWDANVMGKIFCRMHRLRRLDLRNSVLHVAHSLHHVLLTLSSGFREMSLVVLGSSLPPATVHAILQSRVAPAPELHIIIARSRFQSVPADDFVLTGSALVSTAVFSSVDFWLDSCIIP
jgi:hypothetical protein